jgi:adenylosuccinate synthase
MKIQVVVGAQYGSEGKGAVCAKLAKHGMPMVAVRVGGSQAGHTVVAADGVRWPLRHVPVAAVVNPEARLYIAPGSQIDPEVLLDEITRLDAAGYAVSSRLAISPNATVIEQVHKDQEAQGALTDRLGSTAKGVGAARAARIWRTATLWKDHPMSQWYEQRSPRYVYRDDRLVQIEGVQGYALGLHSDWYPFCTSADTTAIDFIAMAGIPAPWKHKVEVWMAIRPNPIRVAGNSGPMKGETTWEDLGLAPEKTTVTQKIRRVGAWDIDLVRDAARANGALALSPVLGALTMADHIWPELAGQDERVPLPMLPSGARERILELEAAGVRTMLLGTGPDTMIEVVQ